MTVVLQINFTGRPKNDLIAMAYEECGLAGYEFTLTPEEVQSANRRLDVMMGEWPWNLLGYNDTSHSPEDISNVPDDAVSAVVTYLALRLAPGMGAAMSNEAKKAMLKSYNLVCGKYGGGPPTQPLAPNTVRGSGNSPFTPLSPFINEEAVT